MDIIKLTASRRDAGGKGPSRRLRREGKIPAIAYGSKLTPLPLAVSPKELRTALGSVHGQNAVIALSVDGKEEITAMVRQYAHHPVTRELLHADFIQIDLKEMVDVDVPFKLTGKCIGIVQGGVLSQVFRRLPVRSLPENIPAGLELDVTNLAMGESTKASELKLPEGVTVRLSPDQTIATVVAPDKRAEAEEAAQAAAKTAAAPAAAAAAPAAADKKPAGKK